MRPELWQPPVECSPAEQKIITRIRRAKLFVFLRQYRHEIFDQVFQAELRKATPTARKVNHRYRQPNWRWPRFCKPILACRTMKSSRRR